LKNALARGAPECRKWHPGWEPLHYWNMLLLSNRKKLTDILLWFSC